MSSLSGVLWMLYLQEVTSVRSLVPITKESSLFDGKSFTIPVLTVEPLIPPGRNRFQSSGGLGETANALPSSSNPFLAVSVGLQGGMVGITFLTCAEAVPEQPCVSVTVTR